MQRKPPDEIAALRLAELVIWGEKTLPELGDAELRLLADSGRVRTRFRHMNNCAVRLLRQRALRKRFPGLYEFPAEEAMA